jgi:hypothetical protein
LLYSDLELSAEDGRMSPKRRRSAKAGGNARFINEILKKPSSSGWPIQPL